MAYFVVDFKIRGDHPSCYDFLEKIRAKLLTFLDENKTKVLVTSDVDELRSYAGFNASENEIIYDIRPLKAVEQIEANTLRDETWKTESKLIDIFLMPNVEAGRIKNNLNQLRSFLAEQKIETADAIFEEFSNTGLITAKLDEPSTLRLLEKTSFIFKVNKIPQVDQESLDYNNGLASSNSGQLTMLTQFSNLPEVCVIDSGVNYIRHLENLISVRGHDNNIPDDNDYNNHGTPVAYLVAYGEGNKARARIISHKIISGQSESNLVIAIARAIAIYRHRSRIFTCSITFRNDDDSAYETWIIDRLVQASNACVLFSAGNVRPPEIQRFQSLGIDYPRYFTQSPVKPPSNSPSVLCVGACAIKSRQGFSIAPANSPSPITRFRNQCDLISNCVKPEVVEHGGNLNQNYTYTGVGVDTVSSSGEATEKIGTSFSTPIIAGHISEIVQKYGNKIKNPETLKAIIISSCAPTENHPAYTGFGRPIYSEILNSNAECAKLIFEGEIKLSNSQLKENVPANRIMVYIPSGVDTIEMVVVHSDNYDIPSRLGLNTYLEVVPEKPARDTKPPPDSGDLNGQSHVKRLVWNYRAYETTKGVWFFWLVPHHIGIPAYLRDKVTLRYGAVIKLTAQQSKGTNLIAELRKELSEHLYY
jgi:hypothetical protein